MNIIDEYKSKIKENPNNYIIVKKYNNKVFNKYKKDLFEWFENEFEKNISLLIDKYTENFATVTDIEFGDRNAAGP